MKLLTRSMLYFAVLLSCCTPREHIDGKTDNLDLLNGFNIYTDNYSTRASIDTETGRSFFSDGDSVLVHVPASGVTGTYKYSSQNNRFEPSTGAIDMSGEAAYAYYPASLFTGQGEKVCFTMPAYVPTGDVADLGEKAPMAGVLPAGSKNDSGIGIVSFKNLCSILRVRVTGGGHVTGVEIENQNVPIKAAGSYSLTWSGATARDSLIMDTDNKVYKSSIPADDNLLLDKPTDYYFLLPATAEENINGLKITVRFSDKNSIEKLADGPAPLKQDGHCRIITFNITEELFSGGGDHDDETTSGKGSQDDPYLISSADDLKNIQNWSINGRNALPADHFLTAHYRQTAELDMSGINSLPIGGNAEFKGSYDGGGFKIRNLKIDMTRELPSGMFGKLGDGALVKNVNLEGLALNSSWAYAGGIAGMMDKCSVENCSVSGTVITSGASDNKSYTGGIAGRIDESTVIGCSFKGMLAATSNHAGGIVGTCDGDCTVSDCVLKAGSSVQCNYYCGGIAASLSGANAEIRGCTCEGSVSSTNWNCGGIIAVLYRGKISSCLQSNVSEVHSGSYNAGGICGSVMTKNDTANFEAYINNCVCYGTVCGTYQVGGICGLFNIANATEKGVISNCACIEGAITASSCNSYQYSLAAGICGYLQGSGAVSVENCFSRPEKVNSINPNTILGEASLIGYSNSASHTLENCYSSATPSEILYCHQPVTSSSLVYYGNIIGRSSGKAVFNRLYYNNSLPLGPASGSNQMEFDCIGYTATEMTDGTLLAKLSSGVASVPGASGWIAGADGYPTLQGLPEDTVTRVVRKRVSIIGDSISTFKGWIQADKVDDHRYCSVHYPKEDITTVDQTWWYSLIYNYMRNGKFEMNISGGNTTVVENWTATASSNQYWYGWDFCTRFQYFKGVGRPDIVFIHGGTNDLGHISSYGATEELIAGQAMNSSAAPSASALAGLFATADACATLSEAEALEFKTFCSAYIKLVKMIKLRYPSAKIVCIIGDCVSGGQSAAIKSIADHYGAKYVDFLSINGYRGTSPLTKYTGNVVHPDANGMDFMAKTIYQQLGSWLEE